MRAAAFAALVFLASAAAAHHGEYLPPLEPPGIDREPKPEGDPVPTPRGEGGATTPGPEGTEPSAPGPGPVRAPERVAPVDARFTPRAWWEANRHRFLPDAPPPPVHPEVKAILLDLAAGESAVVRDRALLAVARARLPGAFGAVSRAFNAGEGPGRIVPALAFGLLGDESAAKRLLRLARDAKAHPGARATAALSLSILPGDRGEELVALSRSAREATGAVGAALALGRVRSPAAREELIRVLGSGGPLEALAAAASGLGGREDGKAAGALVDALRRGGGVGAAAALALGRTETDAGTAELRDRISEGPTRRACSVLLALAERGDGEGLETAVAAVMGSGPDRASRLGPFAALALGVAGRAARLVPILADRDERTALRSAAALGLAAGAARPAEDTDREEVRRKLKHAISTETDEAVLGPALIAAARWGVERTAGVAARTLAGEGPPEVRRDAVTALGVVTAPDTADLLAERLADAYHVNREAAWALARTNPERAARELTERLTADGAHARRYAADRLGRLLAPGRPGPLAELVARMDLFTGSPLVRFLLHAESEYLHELLWAP